MKCPKCGLEQPESQVCASCGIVIEKFLARQRIASNPAEAIKSALNAVAKQLQRDGFFFSPDIPAEQWQNSLSCYPPEEAVGQDEEVLTLFPEPILGRKILDLMDNTLFTTKRIIQVSRVNGHVKQIDWKDVRTVAFAGILSDKLKVNNADLLVGALNRLTGAEKQVFLAMIKTLVRNLNQTGPGKPVKITPLTNYSSIKEGSIGAVQQPTPTGMPEPEAAVEPAMTSHDEIPPAITPGKETAPQARMPQAAKAYVSPPPPGAVIQPDDDDLLIEETPLPEVSSGRWLLAQVVGFVVGGAVGIPIGRLIGELIHLPGKWPYYLGLFVAASIWTAIANAIKYAGASKN